MEPVTSRKTKRLLYFLGHKKQSKSAMITRVCKNYETVSTVHTGESATRTLANLYNLHAVRGALNDNGELIADTAMSGPHHYFGFLDPTKHHTIGADMLYREVNPPLCRTTPTLRPPPQRPPVPAEPIMRIAGYRWRSGHNLEVPNPEYVDTTTGEALQTDSLFDAPGILELPVGYLLFKLITDAYRYDLSAFRAQIVPNREPFAFDPLLVSANRHAQHKLRVVTYNYGKDYVDGYLLTPPSCDSNRGEGSGIFIERHEFVQAITPLSTDCGGYVILGRENNGFLELIVVTIPFGYTLLVEPWAIHGDSTLTGMHMMAMTGNHEAMRTADTVFMKHEGRSVNCMAYPYVSPSYVAPDFFSADYRPKLYSSSIPSLIVEKPATLLLTSDKMPLSELLVHDHREKEEIYNSLSVFEKMYWRPVILTGNKSVGWTKTLGTELPYASSSCSR